MVTKSKKSTTADSSSEQDETGTRSGAWAGIPPLSGSVKESAQQIWLAGLGAFAKAQEEGGKVFEALVKEGASIQRKTQAAAEEKFSEASSRMASMATDISSKASGQWDKLETIFEDRVSKALNRLGVPTAKDIEALSERIDELNRRVSRMNAGAGRAGSGSARAAKQPSSSTPKPAARRASSRKST